MVLVIPLVHLKELYMDQVRLSDQPMSVLLLLLRSSPNLGKLKLMFLQIQQELGMEDKCLGLNTINNLPPSIIETILCLVPFQEAARTSILSREWKYHWTKVPKLVFTENVAESDDESDVDQIYDEEVHFDESHVDESDVDADELLSMRTQSKRRLFNAINQVMSMHQGPIYEFSLSTNAEGPFLCADFDHIIDNLSRNNAIKKVTLDISGYTLSESFFFMHKLTDVYLHHCRLDVPPTFSGFGCLGNLYMENVIITRKMLLLFLSSCPLLKTVVLNPYLRSLPAIDDFTLIELFECLPMVENLSVCISMLQSFDKGRVSSKLTASLVHLKYLCIRDSCDFENRIPYFFFMLRSCPNLEKLKMKIDFDIFLLEGWSVICDRYSDMWFEHLNELEIHVFDPRGFRLNILKVILAKSPVLKTLKILVFNRLSKSDMLNMRIKFSPRPRVSHVVKLIIESGVRFDQRPFIRGL